MYIGEYINGLIDSELGGDKTRFDELWHRVPAFSKKLREFNDDSSWLHWTKKTYDGWYCVRSFPGYKVYFQERGSVSNSRFFLSEQEAVREAIDASVLTLSNAI